MSVPRVMWLAALGAMTATLAACGGSSSAGTSGKALASLVAPKSGCGSYPQPKAQDPDGVLASLPGSYQAAYAGYATPVLRSAWAHWKPTHAPPYTIGIEWNAITTDFQRVATTKLETLLKASPLVGNVLFQSTGNNFDVGTQIAQTDQMLQRKPDLMILEVLTADSFVPEIDRAAKQGIPTIVTMDSPTSGDRNSVNIQPNGYGGLAQTTAYLARLLKRKGSVLYAHGLATTGVDISSFKGFQDTIKRCPQIKLVGQVYTDFTVANAKSLALQFLATHPQRIDAVAQTAAVAPGIMSAFQQTGRPIPTVEDNGGSQGSLSYWRQHQDQYTGIGYGFSGTDLADTTAAVAVRMLDGQGIKLTDVTNAPPLITDQNLDQWAPPKPVPLFSTSESEGPPNNFTNALYLDGLFNHPGPLPSS